MWWFRKKAAEKAETDWHPSRSPVISAVALATTLRACGRRLDELEERSAKLEERGTTSEPDSAVLKLQEQLERHIDATGKLVDRLCAVEDRVRVYESSFNDMEDEYSTRLEATEGGLNELAKQVDAIGKGWTDYQCHKVRADDRLSRLEDKRAKDVERIDEMAKQVEEYRQLALSRLGWIETLTKRLDVIEHHQIGKADRTRLEDQINALVKRLDDLETALGKGKLLEEEFRDLTLKRLEFHANWLAQLTEPKPTKPSPKPKAAARRKARR